MSNLEYFDICVGRVFKVLLENFPLKSDIVLESFMDEKEKKEQGLTYRELGELIGMSERDYKTQSKKKH